MKHEIETLIRTALAKLVDGPLENVALPAQIMVERTRDPRHGDFACNVAMTLAKPARRNPRELAKAIVDNLPATDFVAGTEIAGPGFINFRLAPRAFHAAVVRTLDHGADYGRSELGNGKRVLVEFVSANPTGPLHVGHGRGAAYGATVSNLLDAAGWSDLRDGLRHDAEGKPLRLEIMTTAGNRSRELVQQVLQSQWRRLGIEVSIRNEPARVFFGETVTKRRFPAMAMFAWLSSPENVPRTTLHSEQIPTEANGWGGQNYTGYANPVVDDLILAIETEMDRDKRKALWAELQRIYSEDLPALPLYWRAEPYVLPLWLEGLRPTGHQGTTTLWVEEWRRVER